MHVLFRCHFIILSGEVCVQLRWQEDHCAMLRMDGVSVCTDSDLCVHGQEIDGGCVEGSSCSPAWTLSLSASCLSTSRVFRTTFFLMTLRAACSWSASLDTLRGSVSESTSPFKKPRYLRPETFREANLAKSHWEALAVTAGPISSLQWTSTDVRSLGNICEAGCKQHSEQIR